MLHVVHFPVKFIICFNLDSVTGNQTLSIKHIDKPYKLQLYIVTLLWAYPLIAYTLISLQLYPHNLTVLQLESSSLVCLYRVLIQYCALMSTRIGQLLRACEQSTRIVIGNLQTPLQVRHRESVGTFMLQIFRVCSYCPMAALGHLRIALQKRP